MRCAVLTAIAWCAPGCTLVFPLEEVVDKVPHISEEEEEEPGDTELLIDEFFSYDTTNAQQALPGKADFKKVRQDTEQLDIDVVIMRVGHLKIANQTTFAITGDTPFLILARTVEIEGVIDASAATNGVQGGPGGGRPGMRDPGEGGQGISALNDINTGGGGGGNATDGAAGGAAECLAGVPGGAPGPTFGDDTITILRGGGAGGSSFVHCSQVPNRGGFGGGGLQISATESITIAATGRIRASGGGGGGGSGGTCSLMDDAGSGGGAGGSIFLDAPQIANEGGVEAFGGGGGGGGDDAENGTGEGNGMDGQPGHWGNEVVAIAPSPVPLPSAGGTGQGEKGTTGGNGARNGGATAGIAGDCTLAQKTFNTGGGGGAFGRIVVRVKGEVSPFGEFSPPPRKVPYPAR